MKILTLLLAAACALCFGACASCPMKSGSSCCTDSAKGKTCPPNDPHCKVKPKAS